MACLSMRAAVIVVVTVAAAVVMPVAEGQTECVSKLLPCYSFLNTTGRPSAECCGSIKEAVEKQLACLCTIYTSPGLLRQFNVSVPQALGLSRRCGVPVDISDCHGAGAPSPASLPPPGTPGKDNGAADKITCIGITSLVLSFASTMMFY